MQKIPVKVERRIAAGLKKYQAVFTAAKDRDINESDTVVRIVDFLSEALGFDKYAEITTEYAIRGTYCDLAVKIGPDVKYLIEVKAVGVGLKAAHLRQAFGYAAQEGLEWVVLTNGIHWQVHRMHFEQPVRSELVCALDLLTLSPRSKEAASQFFLLSREGFVKSALDEFREHRNALSPFLIAQVLLSAPLVDRVQRELRRASAGARLSDDEVLAAMTESVIKRDLLAGDAATDAKRRIQRTAKRTLRRRKRKPAAEPPAKGVDQDEQSS